MDSIREGAQAPFSRYKKDNGMRYSEQLIKKVKEMYVVEGMVKKEIDDDRAMG